MSKEKRQPILILPKIPTHHVRGYYKCKICGAPMYRDYVPYTFSTPLLSMPCGHIITSHPSNFMASISKEEAIRLLKRQYVSITEEL